MECQGDMPLLPSFQELTNNNITDGSSSIPPSDGSTDALQVCYMPFILAGRLRINIKKGSIRLC